MRPALDSTQLIRSPLWDNPRAHLLEDMWLMTILAILVATAVPWFAGQLHIELGSAGVGLVVLGGIQVAFAVLSSPAPARARGHVLTVLQLAGVLAMGFVWKHAGALQNPLFLTVFTLPVIGSIFLSRWHPYLVALVGLVVVGVVALSESPELRWYAGSVAGADARLEWLLGARSAVSQTSFSALDAPPSYFLVALEVFAILLLACAVAAEHLCGVYDRLSALAVVAKREAEHGQEMWAGLIEHLPLPTLLIEPASQRIIAASLSASAAPFAGGAALEGRNLFEVVQFSYPETIQEMLTGPDGDSPTCVVRMAGALRLTHVRSVHVAYKARRLALLTLQDASDHFWLRAALDSAEYAVLVIDAAGRVLAFNAPASGLFARLQVGAAAVELLPKAGGKSNWWDPGVTRRRKMHVEIGPRIYQLTSASIRLPGEEDSVYSASFLPVAAGAPGDPADTGITLSTGTLRQLR